MVAGLLYLFRKIYGEVVGALPLNGGAYNVLLNTTSKSNASIAACLTILSYMATAVLSAGEAMNYLYLIAPIPHLPVLWATAGLLTFFLLLTSAGMSESAIVAVVIFIAHLISLTLLVLAGGVVCVAARPHHAAPQLCAAGGGRQYHGGAVSGL